MARLVLTRLASCGIEFRRGGMQMLKESGEAGENVQREKDGGTRC